MSKATHRVTRPIYESLPHFLQPPGGNIEILPDIKHRYYNHASTSRTEDAVYDI